MKQQSAAPKSGAFDPFVTMTCKRVVFIVYTFMAYKNNTMTIHVANWLCLDIYKNWTSDKICFSVTFVYMIYYYWQIFAWTKPSN